MGNSLTVTEALVKLKLTDKKITDAQNGLVVGYISAVGASNLPVGFTSQDDFKSATNSKLQAIEDLIRYRDKLKKAIVTSNAATPVTVGKETMTVAEAIERKRSIELRKTLYNRLNANWADATNKVQSANATLSQRADEFIAKMYAGPTASASVVDKEASRTNFIKANTLVFVTPDKTSKLIDELRTEIEDFEANVDTALSVVNATTVVMV